MDQVGLCNLALGSVGAKTTISSLTESSAAARQCLLQYDAAAEAVLQAAHWNFARAQVTLSLLKDGTATPSQNVPQPWVYEYAYPSDCVAARYVMPLFATDGSSVPGVAAMPYYQGPPRVPFLISSDLDSQGNRNKVILTNQPSAVLVYTTRIDDVSLFDGQFVLALAAYLGARVAIPLTGDKNMAKMAFDQADRTCRTAQASNGNEGLTVVDSTPDWISARGYSADWGNPPGSLYILPPVNLSMVS